MDVQPVYAPPPVIEPGHTFSSVTEQIAGIVLTRRHPYSWFFGLFIGFMMTMVLFVLFVDHKRLYGPRLHSFPMSSNDHRQPQRHFLS